MIQRIQTLFLLAVVFIMALGCFMPLVEFDNGFMQYSLSAWKFSSIDAEFTANSAVASRVTTSCHYWGLFIISVIIPLVALLTIFLFKKRMVQIRFCIFNILLMIGYYALLALAIMHILEQHNTDFFLKLPAFFPLISIILSWLAIRGIGKDEALVRKSERIR